MYDVTVTETTVVVHLAQVGPQGHTNIVIGTTPPNNDDGQPDGTLYLQVS